MGSHPREEYVHLSVPCLQCAVVPLVSTQSCEVGGGGVYFTDDQTGSERQTCPRLRSMTWEGIRDLSGSYSQFTASLGEVREGERK